MNRQRTRRRRIGSIIVPLLLVIAAMTVIASQLQTDRPEPVVIVHDRFSESAALYGAAIDNRPTHSGQALSDAERSRLAIMAVESVAPAVVVVHRATGGERSGDRGARERIGSGVVIDPSGYIVASLRTTGRSGEIRITYATGETVEAEIVRIDELYQLVLLRVKEPPPAVAELATYVPSSGDQVLAIGTPLEDFSSTVTGGVIGAVGVTMPAVEERDPIPGVIQHDAAINAGNEGGPLVDLTGRVVAINVGSIVDRRDELVQGWSFAVPVVAITLLLADLD